MATIYNAGAPVAEEGDTGPQGLTTSSDKLGVFAQLVGFLGKPSAAFVAFVYLFPLIWMIGYLGVVAVLARCVYALGGYLAAFAPIDFIFGQVLAVPVLFFFFMFGVSGWFRWQSPLVFMVWILIFLFSTADVEDNLMMTMERACGNQIKDNINVIERRSAYGYFPNRLWSWENSQVTSILQTIKEPVICENVSPNFVCRLLVLHLAHSPLCYRVDKTPCGGTLTFKKLEKDPISSESAMQTNSAVSRTADLSPEMMREISLLVEDARRYYEQNKFIDPDCFARQRRMLLEFQVDGRYYFYTFLDEKEPDRRPNNEPTPAFISRLRDLLAGSAGSAVPLKHH